MGDCSVDVVLNKITGIVKQEIERYRNTPDASEVLLQIEEQDKWAIAGISSLRDQEVRSRVLAGGRLVSIYTMAEMGELPYNSEVSITATVPITEKAEALDAAVLEHLKDATRAELECQVCYALFLDPLTTSCGHTFCRKCIGRVRDHSNLCPVCRRTLAMPSGEKATQSPSNILICKLLIGLCPEALALRVAMDKEAEKHEDLELDTPIFVCTLSFPSIPTFLHIFEPRYRLMIRRALESGDRKFGMVLHNPTREPQGALGPVAYCQYGTMLEIINMQLLPDGRSVIETVGVSRFRVLKDGELDNYKVCKIERIEDMSIGDEEELEVRETSSSPNPRIFSAQDHFGAPPQHLTTAKEPLRAEDINSMPTRELFETGVAFVKKMRDQSAPWLHHRVFQAYGECPTDPALFPWWLASVLPIADGEKYKLLPTASVRERLKMCVGWISGIESQRWYVDAFSD
jgi:Lon protease-like protein